MTKRRKNTPTRDDLQARQAELARQIFEMNEFLLIPDTELQQIQDELRSTYHRGLDGSLVVYPGEPGAKEARDPIRARMDENNARWAPQRRERAGLYAELKSVEKRLERLERAA